MARWEDMWSDLERRIESAKEGPVTDDRLAVLEWVESQMVSVWNDHRHDDEGDLPTSGVAEHDAT